MPSEKPSRRLAAILAADIAGYSRLMGEDEVATVQDLKACQAIGLPLISEFGGRVIDTAGDGILAEFGSAVAAVECAKRFQTLTSDRNATMPEHRRMQFRIGINLGEVIHDESRLYGEDINIAARLEGLAQPGGICVSAKVREEVEGKVALSFQDVGVQQLKNIAKPVRVYVVGAHGPPSKTQSSPEPSEEWMDAVQAKGTPRLSIVVLPFSNENGDSSSDYFADGITEDVTTQLSAIKGSYVIGRNTAFRYKNKPVDVAAIGKELGVRYVLQGRVERVEKGVDTTVRLVDAASGSTVWEDLIEVDAASVRNIRREVVTRMTIALNIPLTYAEAKRSRQEHPIDPDVVDLVLQARAAFYGRYSLESLQGSQHLFERALSVRPDDQQALVGCALVMLDQVYAWPGRGARELLERADEMIRRAVPLDWHDAYAHYVLSRLRHLQGQLPAAIAENETALELNHNLVEAIAWRGFLHTYSGQPELAIDPLLKVIAQSPKDRMRWYWYAWLGSAYLLAGKYNDAALWLERSIATNAFWSTLALVAVAYANSGDMENAKRSKARFDEVYSGEDLDFRRHSPNKGFVTLIEERVLPPLRLLGFPVSGAGTVLASQESASP